MLSRSIAGLMALLLSPALVARTPAQPPAEQPVAGPTFRTGVDLIRLDVTVVQKDGTPIEDLTVEDFEVKVDGKVRPVVTSRFLSLQRPPLENAAGTSLSSTRDFTSNDTGMEGRLFVLAIDHESLPTGAGRPLMMSVAKLLEQMGPSDQVALVAVPQPGQRIEFTRDLESVKRGLSRVTGRRQMRVRTVRVSFDEALAYEQGNQTTMQQVLERECFYRSDEGCPNQIEVEYREVLQENRERIHATLTNLSGLADSLAGIDGPKTVIFMSGGLGYELRSLNRYKEFARRAAEARATFYTVSVDSFNFDTSEKASSAAFMGDVDSGRRGLETLSGLTGGGLFLGTAKGVGIFERIGREARGLYVLGIEPEQGTPPTAPLDLRVRVKRPGLTVRSPQQVVPPAPLTAWKDPRRAIGYTLKQPRAATELPLKVATYTVRGNDDLRLKTVIAAELALPVGQAAELAWGFEVLDRGRVIADAFSSGLPQGSSATDGGVMLVTAASLPAGQYHLRFAAIDAAGRRGSIEHPIAVGLRMTHVSLGAQQTPERLYFSDLLVGTDVNSRFQPRLQFNTGSAVLSAWLELYGGAQSGLDRTAVEFDIRGLDGATRLLRRVPTTAAEGDFRRVAIADLPLTSLTPGSYELHAKVLVDGRPVGLVRRQIVIGPGPMAAR
jgi:VWFA-related protein